MAEDSGRGSWYPGIVELFEKAQDQPSAVFADLDTGRMMKIRAGRLTFYMASLNPATREAVLSCDGDLRLEAAPCVFIGSTWGSSMVKPAILVVGMCLEFSFGGSRLTTPVVESLQICHNEKTVENFVAAVEARRYLALPWYKRLLARLFR